MTQCILFYSAVACLAILGYTLYQDLVKSWYNLASYPGSRKKESLVTHCSCMYHSNERHERVTEYCNGKFASVAAFLISWVCEAPSIFCARINFNFHCLAILVVLLLQQLHVWLVKCQYVIIVRWFYMISSKLLFSQ